MITSEEQYVAVYRRLMAAYRSKQKVPRLAQALETALKQWDQSHAVDRLGDWIPTYSGRRFWLLDPRPEDIDIRDIARGLALINRFNGATTVDGGYSVAQHSIYVSEQLPPEYQLEGLLHDAPEAYTGDLVTPMKRLVELHTSVFRQIDDDIMRAVARRFSVERSVKSHEAVKKADMALLATEGEQIVPAGFIKDFKVEPLPLVIEAWTPEFAEQSFLKRFEELYAGA